MMKKHEVRESEMNKQAFYAYSNSSYTVYEDGDAFAIALNEREKPGIYVDDLEAFFQQVYNEDCIWYAVMQDREDTDHGYGSNDLEESKKMCREMKEDYPDAYIAVISPADDFCLEEIEVE